MAGQTFFIHNFGCGCSRIEDQCNVAALFVRFAGAVAALAGHAFAAGHSRPAMRIAVNVLHYLFVTGCAGGCVRGVGRGLLHGLLAVGIGFACLSRDCCDAKHRHTEQQHEAGLRTEPFAHRRSLELLQYRLAALAYFHCAGGLSSPLSGSCAVGGPSDGWILNGSGPMWPRWQVPQVTGAPELSIMDT